MNKQTTAILTFPTIMIGLFFLAPFLMIVAVSVAHQNPGGFYEAGFELTHYKRLMRSTYLDIAVFSISLSAAVSLICLLIGFPFTYFVTRLRRRSQVIWLVYILAQLSLSEVLIAFGWQILLSKTVGISNLLVWLGLAEKSVAMYPGLGAVVVSLVYLVLPFTFLLLYPTISRLDPDVVAASGTLGASPIKTFFLIVIPVLRVPLVAAGIIMFVFTLGAVLTPQVLGKPTHWTLSVHITDQAIFQSNLPFASALALLLLLISTWLVLITLWLNRNKLEQTG